MNMIIFIKVMIVFVKLNTTAFLKVTIIVFIKQKLTSLEANINYESHK